MQVTILALFEEEGKASAAVRMLKAERMGARVRMVRPEEARMPHFGRWAKRWVGWGAALGLGIGVLAVLAGRAVLHSGGEGTFELLMAGVAGAFAGGLVGGLLSQAAGAEDLFYREELQAGRSLVRVKIKEGVAERARAILLAQGAMEAEPHDGPTLAKERVKVQRRNRDG